MKKFIFILFSLVTFALIGYATLFQNESIKFLILFLLLGFGLAFLRLFVNHSIKQMKRKHIFIKILFFSTLLGLGLPFQNWFRKNIIMTIDRDYIINCIVILISGIIIMTMVASKISWPPQRKSKRANS